MKVLQEKLDKIAIASLDTSRATDKYDLTNKMLEKQRIDLQQDYKRTQISEFDYQRRAVSLLTRFSNNNKEYMNILRNNFKILGRPREINFILRNLGCEQFELKGYISKRDRLMNEAFIEENK